MSGNEALNKSRGPYFELVYTCETIVCGCLPNDYGSKMNSWSAYFTYELYWLDLSRVINSTRLVTATNKTAGESVRLTLVTRFTSRVLRAVRSRTEGNLKLAQIDENPARALHMWNKAIGSQHLHIFLLPAKSREWRLQNSYILHKTPLLNTI